MKEVIDTVHVKAKPNPNWAQLPLFQRKNWTKYKFSQIAQNIGERADPTPEDSELYVGLEHMVPGSLHIRSWGSATELIGTKFRMRKGDVLFARRNAYLRRVAIAPHDGLFSAHGLVLRAKPETCLHEFLPFLMMSKTFMDRAEQISVGSLSPTINWSSLKDLEFDLPPIDSQRRLASILSGVKDVDSAYHALNGGLANALSTTRSRALLGEFTHEGRKTTQFGQLPSTWSVVRLSDVLKIVAGNAFRSADFIADGIQLIRLSNLFGGQLDLSRSAVFLPEHFSERYPSFIVRPGDILFSMTGTVGKEDYAYSVVVPEESPLCLLNQRVAKLIPGPSILPEYLLQYLWSRHFLDQIYSKAAGSKQANVSNKDIYSALIPLPPVKDQSTIVSRLQKLERALIATSRAKVAVRSVLEALLSGIQ